MTGAVLKEKLSATQISFSEIARKAGLRPQDLNTLFNVQDTKTGTIEKLSQALDLPIAYFYGDSYNVTGNNNATGNNNTVNANDDRLIQLLLNKDEQLTMAMKQTSKAQEHMDVVLNVIKGNHNA